MSCQVLTVRGRRCQSTAWSDRLVAVPRVHFTLQTTLGPDRVLGVLTDFSEHRAEVWPNIDRAHFTVHGQGPGWADVTEGNAVAGGVWERNRYEWGKEPNRLEITTTDSNTWRAGSGWDYHLTPLAAGGTSIRVDVLRRGRGAKGALLGLVIGALGARILRSDMQKVLGPLERR
jgi:hypothetical protein